MLFVQHSAADHGVYDFAVRRKKDEVCVISCGYRSLAISPDHARRISGRENHALLQRPIRKGDDIAHGAIER